MRRHILCLASILLYLLIVSMSPVLAQDFEMRTVAYDVPTGWGVTTGDYDGDGDIDIATTGKNPGRVVWFETRPNETPIEHFLYQVGGGARYISTADLDNDSDLDLVVGGYGEGRFIWFENRGTDFPDLFEIHDLLDGQPGAWQAIPVDLDDDDITDLAMCSYNGNSVSVMLTSANGDHNLLASYNLPDPIGVFAVDHDQDDDMDILIASSGTSRGGIFLLEQTGSLEFELSELYVEEGLRVTSVCATDLDDDDDIDFIVTQLSNSNGVSWFESTPGGLIRHNLYGYMMLPRNVVTADFDDDGRIDIAATWHGSNLGMGGLYWWRNTGHGEFEYHAIHESDSPYDLHLTDFDLDGDEDLLVPLSAVGEIALFKNLLGITATIEGVVTSHSSGLPIVGVSVTAVETHTTALTGLEGFYHLNVAEGIHTIEIEDDCWDTVRVELVVAIEDSTTTLDLELRQPVIHPAHSSLNAQVYNELESRLTLSVDNRGDADLVINANVVDSDWDAGWLRIEPEQTLIEPGGSLDFSVIVVPDTSNSAAWDYFGEIELHSNSCPDTVIEIPVFVRVMDAPFEAPAVPTETALHPVYPNPFNATAGIRYDLAVPGTVTLILYDIQGRETRTLYSAYSSAGSHELELNGNDLASGLYFLRMTTETAVFTQKLHLLK